MQTFDKVKCQVYSYFADLFLASCSSSHLFLFHNDQAMTQHCPNAVRETRDRRDTVTAILWFHYSVATHPVFRDHVYLWLVTQYCAHTRVTTIDNGSLGRQLLSFTGIARRKKVHDNVISFFDYDVTRN